MIQCNGKNLIPGCFIFKAYEHDILKEDCTLIIQSGRLHHCSYMIQCNGRNLIPGCFIFKAFEHDMLKEDCFLIIWSGRLHHCSCIFINLATELLPEV